MAASSPTVVVTGIAGNLGRRLLAELADFQVVGLDLNPPQTSLPLRYQRMDLGQEESCRELYLLLRQTRPVAVVHLAFVIDPVRTGVLDVDRMWHINVAGTARVMEAVTEANRDDVLVQKFIFPSSVSAYGPDLPGPVSEDFPLGAHTLPYAIHKMECDQVVQQRAPALRGCSAYMLRPHIFAGASVQNYLMGAFHGTPNGRGRIAAKWRDQGKRLPCILPYGKRYLNNRIQFVHVDDMARLIAHIIRKTEPESQRLTVLNVAGRGEPLTFARCLQMARANLVRSPGKWAMRWVLRFGWKSGISAIPPEAVPYMTGEYTMNTDRLRKFLGTDYENVMRYTITDAFTSSFVPEEQAAAQRSGAV
ncbi:MAG TPA: NAD-dependent epimerase/dehydratase family protein [Terriglobales bacterium]|jgi:nucleoside-diphosphate-sugar epimerase|nr:NAD-dependent epimerase/dehydratase family protein [Terriglobales bacterium]